MLGEKGIDLTGLPKSCSGKIRFVLGEASLCPDLNGQRLQICSLGVRGEEALVKMLIKGDHKDGLCF